MSAKFIEDDVMTAVFDDNETYKRDRIIYGDEIPVEEECLEIEDSDEDICMTFKSEPMDGLISPIPPFNEHLKSPFNSISDCGYESVGSPASIHDFTLNTQQDDLNYLLNDLFPSLT